MSDKSDEDLVGDAKELDDIEADEETDENELPDEDHKSDDGSLTGEQSAEMSEEEEAFEQSQTDVRPQKLTESGEESGSEEGSVHSVTSKETKIRGTTSGQSILLQAKTSLLDNGQVETKPTIKFQKHLKSQTH